MELDERLALINDVGEEITTKEDLAKLLEEKKHPIAYDGFEPSGNIHIAQGLLRAININKMVKAGFKFKMLVADWHAAANNKFEGDMDKIHVAGKYFIEVWKACGMKDENIEFVWVSDLTKDPEYWKLVLKIARISTLDRVKRCSQIMGRGSEATLSAAQILYPCMQAADIFYLKADATQLGMDQRKVNMLAREIGEKIGYWKPVVISHHMLMGLGTPMPNIDTIDKVQYNFQIEINDDIFPRLNDLKNNGFGDINKITLFKNKLSEVLFNYEFSKNKTFMFLAMDNKKTLNKYLEDIYKTTDNLIGICEGRTSHEQLTPQKYFDSQIDYIMQELNAFEKAVIQKVKEYNEHRFMSLKMSKSRPDSAIFMTDTEEDIKRKIKKAHCPERIVEENPVLEYCKYIIFEKLKENDASFEVTRPQEHGGNLSINSYKELVELYSQGALHPVDLKNSVAYYINEFIKPVREHFEKNHHAKELKEKVLSYQVTR